MEKGHFFRRSVLAAGLVFLGYVLLGTSLPFVRHRKVSQEYQEEFAKRQFLGEGEGPERVAFVGDNTEALLTRFQMFEEAEQEIIMSTFDFDNDEAGKVMMSALINAADRGVRVKVLLDGFSGLMDVTGSEWFLALVTNENIEMKIYNPISLLRPWDIQTRLHDKYIIIDDKMYLLGGRNNTNLFLGDYQEHKNIDRELLVYSAEKTENRSLQDLRAYFDRIWELPECRAVVCEKKTETVLKVYRELKDGWPDIVAAYPAGFVKPDWTEVTQPVNKVSLLTNPIEAENKEPEIWYGLHRLMLQGKNIIIHTPYIICGKEMYEDLTGLCRTADSVDIITNDVTSGANPWGCTDYLNQKENILETGVTVHEFLGEASNHTKTILIDDRISIVGSYNLDMRSTYLDTEMMLVVDSPELNAVLRQEAAADMEQSKSISKGRDYVFGPKYEPREFTPLKKVIYSVLRVLILPIRYLL